MVNPTRESKKRKRNESETNRPMSLRCEWVECSFITQEANAFYQHVEEHEAHPEYSESNGKIIISYCCLWDQCGFSSQGPKTTRFHINYHGFHTRIKAYATMLLKQQNHLDCHLNFAKRNTLPELPSERNCGWSTCDFRTNSYQRLLDHANEHVTGQPRRRFHQSVYCEWQQCKKVTKNMTMLKSHLRSHTQEKKAACPVCGVQFANKTKFIDHCARQAPAESKRYQCSYCKKKFASERLLHDHIRLHVNLHKCPMCDMTCPFKSTLTVHIRYRHLSDKPFTCKYCKYKSTTKRDMESHYHTHGSEKYLVCRQPGCTFSCRSKNGLNSHHAKMHTDTYEEYGCHICDDRFSRGASLTVHLKVAHSYRWASGQSRFRYIKDDNGVHRLQTCRYESMEVTEQIMANATARRPNRSKKFICATIAPDKLVITENNENSVGPNDPGVYVPELEPVFEPESHCNNLDLILDG